MRKELHIDTDKEICFFDEWDEGVLRTILSDHTKVIQLLKERKGKQQLPGIAVIVDDFADSPEVTHNPRNVITSLFVRGRHSMVSTFISTQKLRAISTPVRVNATAYIVFRLRNQHEYEQIAEEMSALVGKQQFREIYELATREPYSFMVIKTNAKELEDTFMVRFEQKISLE